MDTKLQKAFDFAQDTAKQVLTLASGIIAITITFLNGKLATYPGSTAIWLEIGWGLYLGSILFGVGALMCLSGNLEKPGIENNQPRDPSIYRGNIVAAAALQLILFLTATLCVLIFGFNATGASAKHPVSSMPHTPRGHQTTSKMTCSSAGGGYTARFFERHPLETVRLLPVAPLRFTCAAKTSP